MQVFSNSTPRRPQNVQRLRSRCQRARTDAPWHVAAEQQERAHEENAEGTVQAMRPRGQAERLSQGGCQPCWVLPAGV